MSISVKEAAAQLGKKELIERIDLSCEGRRFPEALVWARRLADEFHKDHMLWEILKKIKYSEEEVQQMMKSEEASTLFLVGYMTYEGGGREDAAAALRCFERASELGHVYATYMRGIMIRCGYGVAKDEELALQLWMEAAHGGCGEAADDVGTRWSRQGEYRQAAHYYALAVTLHDSDARGNLDDLLRRHPMEACPFGAWEPTRLMHLQMPPRVKATMFTALLVLRARRDAPTWVHRDVAHIILSYICTH